MNTQKERLNIFLSKKEMQKLKLITLMLEPELHRSDAIYKVLAWAEKNYPKQ